MNLNFSAFEGKNIFKFAKYDIKELNAGFIKFDADTNNETPEGVTEKVVLKNGAILMSDNSIKNGIEVKNTSNGADGFFNYNIVDDNGNVIDVIQKGKLKVSMYTLEGVKKN